MYWRVPIRKESQTNAARMCKYRRASAGARVVCSNKTEKLDSHSCTFDLYIKNTGWNDIVLYLLLASSAVHRIICKGDRASISACIAFGYYDRETTDYVRAILGTAS